MENGTNTTNETLQNLSMKLNANWQMILHQIKDHKK